MNTRVRQIRNAILLLLRLVRLAAVILLVLVTLVVGVGAVLWRYQSDFLSRYVSQAVTRELLLEGYRLEIGDIKGSPFESVALHDLVVTGPAGDSLLVVDEARFRYPPVWGLRREMSLESLTITGAEVQLEERPGGGLVLPWRAPKRRTRGLEPRPAQRIDELSLVELDLRLVTAAGDTVGLTRDFYLDGMLRLEGDEADLRVTGAAGEVPVARLDVDWLTCDARLAEGRIVFEEVVADVGDSHAEGRGDVAIEGPIDYHFEVDTARVSTADAWSSIDLSEVVGNGRVTGRFQIEKAPLGVYLGWDVRGVLEGDPIDRLAGRVQITDERVVIDGLALESLGARVEGDISLEVEAPRRYRAELDAWNVDVSDVPIHGELVPLHAHRMNGHVALTGRDYELDFPDMSLAVTAGPSTYLGVPIDSLTAAIELAPGDSVIITDALAHAGSGTVRARGHIVADGTCDVDVYAVGVPLERLAPLHDVRGLSGEAGFTGRFFGDVEHPEIEGSGAVTALTLPGVAVERAEIPRLDGVLVPFRAMLATHARGVRVASWRADSLALTCTLGDTITVESLRAVAADSVLTAAGRVVVDGSGAINARAEALDLDIPIGHAHLVSPASLDRSADGRLSAGPASFEFADGTLEVGVVTEAEGRNPRTTLSSRGIALFDLMDPHVGSVSLTGGVTDIDLVHVDDPLAPSLTGRAHIDALGVGDIAVDETSFTFAGHADSLAVEDLVVALGGGSLSGSFVIAGGESAVKDLVSPDPLAVFADRGRRVRASLDADSIDVALSSKIAHLFGPEVADTLRLVRLLYTRDREAMQDLWHAIDGRADIHLSTEGSLSDPALRLRIASDSLIVRGQPLEGVRLACVYGDSLLTISQGEITAAGHTTQFTGFVPVRLNLAERTATLVDREMLVALDMPETPLSLAGVIFPDLVVMSGLITGSGTLQGTPAAPLLDGTFRVENGELRLAGRTEWLWDAHARITLTNNAVVVNDFTAKEGSRGRLRATGNWSRMNDYRFQIELEDFTVSQSGMIGIVDGTINMSPDETTAGRLLPRFDGLVRIKNGDILEWPEEGPEQTSGAIDAIYDLTVDVGRVNVNTNELQTTTNAVIGDGELTVRNYPETLRLGGTLTVLEGGGTVYGNQFRVRRGELTFLEVDGVNPELDIVAETRIRSAYARQRGFSDTSPRIVATVSGTLKEPVIQLTTEPEDLGLSQTEIFEYLTIGRFATNGDASAGLEPTAEILLGLIAQDLARAVPYVDHVAVTTSEETPSISFVKSLSDEWTIGYTTGVSSSPDQEISVEARLSRILVLKGGVIRDELTTSGEPGGRYNLDLRLNFEY